MPETTKCAHPACICGVAIEREAQHAHYCSDLCAVETTDALCGCGHEACAHAQQHHHPAESVIGLGPEDS